MLCYQSILAARVKLLDLEKIVDRVIRFLEAAMAENLRRSVESFHIAVNGVADEPGSIPPRAMGSSTTSAPTQSPAWSTGLLDAIHWLSQTFLPGSLSSIRYASPQQESRRNAVGQQRLLPSERVGKQRDNARQGFHCIEELAWQCGSTGTFIVRKEGLIKQAMMAPLSGKG